MLESQGLKPQVLDGADPANRERRNKLFGISGLRAKYPQLFVVKSKEGPPTFVGNFDTIQELNECGLLTNSHLLGIFETTSADELSTNTTPAERNSRGLPLTEDGSINSGDSMIQSSTQNLMLQTAQLLLLISNLFGN